MHGHVTEQATPGTFELGLVIERSRSLISGSKRYGLYLLLTATGILMLLSGLTILLFGAEPDNLIGPWWWEVAITAFFAGITAMMGVAFGLYRAQGIPLTYGRLFDFMATLWPLLVIAFPAAYLSLLAEGTTNFLLAFVIPLVLYPVTFVPYFMVDRQLGPLQALGQAFELVLRNVGQFVLFVLLLAALSVLSVFTLGIGFIWVLPFALIANAVIYDEAVGIVSVQARA